MVQTRVLIHNQVFIIGWHQIQAEYRHVGKLGVGDLLSLALRAPQHR